MAFRANCGSRWKALLAASLAVLVSAGALSAPARAEDPTAGRAQAAGEKASHGRGRHGGRARLALVLKIADALDLDEEQTIRLSAEFRRADARRKELKARRATLAAQLEEELGKAVPDREKLAHMTQELFDVEQEIVLMPDRMFESVRSMLTPEQQARLMLLRLRLEHGVRRERERRRHERHRAGWRRNGPGDGPGKTP